MTLADHIRVVRVTLFYFLEGASSALLTLGDKNRAEFKNFARGYKNQAPIEAPSSVLSPSFQSSHPDFRGLVCCVLSDLRVPRDLWDEILENLTGEAKAGTTLEPPRKETSTNPPPEIVDDIFLAWRESAGGEIEYVYPTEWCWRYVISQGYPYRYLWVELRDVLVDYPYKEWPSRAPEEFAKLIIRPGSPPHWEGQLTNRR